MPAGFPHGGGQGGIWDPTRDFPGGPPDDFLDRFPDRFPDHFSETFPGAFPGAFPDPTMHGSAYGSHGHPDEHGGRYGMPPGMGFAPGHSQMMGDGMAYHPDGPMLFGGDPRDEYGPRPPFFPQAMMQGLGPPLGHIFGRPLHMSEAATMSMFPDCMPGPFEGLDREVRGPGGRFGGERFGGFEHGFGPGSHFMSMCDGPIRHPGEEYPPMPEFEFFLSSNDPRIGYASRRGNIGNEFHPGRGGFGGRGGMGGGGGLPF